MLMGVFEPNAAASGNEPTHKDPLHNGRDCDWIYRPGLRMAAARGASASSRSGDGICWEGRLDNRAELFENTHAGNAEIALATIQRGGPSALSRILGDWSLSFWDDARSTVLLAGDYCGVRPLYYHHTSNRTMWSSSLAHLVSRLSCRDDLDELYAAEFLRYGGSETRTPYRGIRLVPPGQILLVSPNGVETAPFWRLEQDQLRFRTESEYAGRFLHLFEEAVAVRLQDHGPVFAELSGGLDSSAIVCMAQRLIREGRVNAAHLTAVHYTDHGSPDQPFRQFLERALDLDSLCIDTREYPYLAENQAGQTVPTQWESRHRRLAGELQRTGASTILTGRLGDLVMGNYFDDSEQVGDRLRELSLAGACTEAMAWSRLLHIPVYSILARALRSVFASQAPEADASEDSLTPEFRRRTNQAPPDSERRMSSLPPSRRKHIRLMHHALRTRCLLTPEPLQPCACSHPYTHRPLVEYMLAVPPSIVCSPGRPRKLMRQSLRDLLPPAILERRSKASFCNVFRMSLQPLAATLLQTPEQIRIVSRGWVEGRNLAARLTRFLQGLECNETQLRNLILLEFWLRSSETRARPAAAIPDLRFPSAAPGLAGTELVGDSSVRA